MKVISHASLWRRVVRNAGRQLFRIAENNDDPQMEANGERWLLRELLMAHRDNGGAGPFV